MAETKHSEPVPKATKRGRRRSAAAVKVRRWASVPETASYYGIAELTVREMLNDGRLRGYCHGSRILRIDLNEADAAMTPYGGAA